jgi:hypothetical protein
MSKFRNRIRDIGRAAGGMGFTAMSHRERTRYALVVAYVQSMDDAEAAVRNGASALVVDEGAPIADITARVDVPVGVRMEDAGQDEVAAAAKAGADFFIFDDARTHASALTNPDIGRVLILGADRQEDRLRAVAAIDLDALLVDADPTPITVREQIELRRVAALTGAPILINSPQAPDTSALAAWRDAGAPLVLVPFAATERAVAAAHEVPPPPRRQRGGEMPMLGAPPVPQDDEDDDE